MPGSGELLFSCLLVSQRVSAQHLFVCSVSAREKELDIAYEDDTALLDLEIQTLRDQVKRTATDNEVSTSHFVLDITFVYLCICVDARGPSYSHESSA